VRGYAPGTPPRCYGRRLPASGSGSSPLCCISLLSWSLDLVAPKTNTPPGSNLRGHVKRIGPPIVVPRFSIPVRHDRGDNVDPETGWGGNLDLVPDCESGWSLLLGRQTTPYPHRQQEMEDPPEARNTTATASDRHPVRPPIKRLIHGPCEE